MTKTDDLTERLRRFAGYMLDKQKIYDTGSFSVSHINYSDYHRACDRVRDEHERILRRLFNTFPEELEREREDYSKFLAKWWSYMMKELNENIYTK